MVQHAPFCRKRGKKEETRVSQHDKSSGQCEFHQASLFLHPLQSTHECYALFPFFFVLLQVARYSALIGGIGYGIIHRRTLQKREDYKATVAEKNYQEKLRKDQQKEQDQKILAAVHMGGNGGES